MNLRYVFSGPTMMNLQPYIWSKHTPEESHLHASTIIEGMQKVQKDVVSLIPGHAMSIDLLFNAYSEKRVGELIVDNNNFGFDKLYADSGGLQIITAGKKITDNMKSSIYETQSMSDYAMCFDEIPVRSANAADTKSHRSQTANKLYYPSMLESCAIKTAHNIKEQIEILDKFNTPTKVHYIVQGNTHDDMVTWFENGIEILEDSHFDKVGGLAVAGTCMGNGSLESIDMLVAYHRILKEFGVNKTKKHIHLLGVGSVSRLFPVLYLINSGFLPKDLTISFDSTSYSMKYYMARFSGSGGELINKAPVELHRFFTETTEYFEEIYQKTCPQYDKKRFVEHLVSNILNRANTRNHFPKELKIAMQANITLVSCWQIFGFVAQLCEAMKKADYDQSPIGMLQYVKTYDDYINWRRNYGRFIQSARVRREQAVTVDNFFS